MTKDEALKLALEALENCTTWHLTRQQFDKNETAITVIKQALAAQPEPNGWAISYDGKTPYAIWPEGDGPLLDLEVKRQGGTCCKLPIYTAPPAAPVQEPVALIDRLINPEQHYEFTDPKKANAVLMSLCQEAADALAAPVQEPVACQVCGGSGFIKCDALQSREKNNGKWGRCLNCQPYTTSPAQPAPAQPMAHIVGEIDHAGKVWTPAQPAPVQPVGRVCFEGDEVVWTDEPPESGTLLYTTPPAQPAVPDALTSADIQEHIEYVAGWNDCRQAMLEMMK